MKLKKITKLTRHLRRRFQKTFSEFPSRMMSESKN